MNQDIANLIQEVKKVVKGKDEIYTTNDLETMYLIPGQRAK